MTAYIATFHTHLSALLTCRALTAAGVAAQMMPVPRRLSAACGTCVRYTADSPMLSCMDTDYEAVYETADNTVPARYCRSVQAIVKMGRPPNCHYEEANGRRGNLGKALAERKG